MVVIDKSKIRNILITIFLAFFKYIFTGLFQFTINIELYY